MFHAISTPSLFLLPSRDDYETSLRELHTAREHLHQKRAALKETKAERQAVCSGQLSMVVDSAEVGVAMPSNLTHGLKELRKWCSSMHHHTAFISN